MTRFLAPLVAAVTLMVGGALSAAVPPAEVAGTVHHWSEAERMIGVSGQQYRLHENAEIMDQEGRSLGDSSLRPGVHVVIQVIGDTAVGVVIGPRTQR